MPNKLSDKLIFITCRRLASTHGCRYSKGSVNQSSAFQKATLSLLPLQADMASEPKMSDEGTLWTPGAVDFFRVVNAQVGTLG